MTTSCQQVRNWLSSRCVQVPDDWLEACIEWIQEENQGKPLSLSQLQAEVYDQWLIADLHILESSTLPPNLTRTEKCIINGNHCLQIDSLLDVSTPFYSQFQKVHGTENENATVSATQQEENWWEPKASRMLMLQLTDGVQSIQGMEYQTVLSLNVSTKPGTKVLIKGPVTSRLGVLMLTSKNVQVLGGEVESLMEESSQRKLLARALHREDLVKASARDNNSFPVQPNITGANNTPQNTNGNNVNEQEMMDSVDDDLFDQLHEDDLQAMEEEWEDDLNDDELLEHVEMQEMLSQETTNTLNDASSLQDVHQNSAGKYLPSTTRLKTDSIQTTRSWSGSSGCTSSKNKIMCTQTTFPSGNKEVGGETISNNGNSRNQNAKYQSISSNTLCRRISSVTGNAEYKPIKQQVSVCENGISYPKPKQPRLDRCISTGNIGSGDTGSNVKHSDNIVNKAAIVSSAFIDLTDDLDDDLFQENPAATSTLAINSFNNPCHSAGQDLTKSNLGIIKGHVASHLHKNSVGLLSECQFRKAEVRLDSRPFTYLSKVVAVLPCAQLTTVRVKAYISTLVSKLEHSNHTAWSLVVKINDGSAAIDVDIANELLCKIIGFSAQECKMMKIKAQKGDKITRERLTKGMKYCQDFLVQLSTIMVLELSPQRIRPCIIDLCDVTIHDVKMLQSRVLKA